MSSTQPQIYEAEIIGSGSLNLMAKPDSGNGIEREFAAIRAVGIDRVVSLLEKQEAQLAGLGNEQQLVEMHAKDFIAFSIRDMELPASVIDFANFTSKLHQDCFAGKNTVVH